MKEYTEESAVKKLQKNRIKVENKTITYKSVGLKLLGAVEYLVNHCGYKKKGEKE